MVLIEIRETYIIKRTRLEISETFLRKYSSKNMVRSLFPIFLVAFTITIQTCLSTHGDPSQHHGQRNINSNTNINANINAHHRKYRRTDGPVHSEVNKDTAEKIVEAAAVASAAADAAKIVTRSLAKKLSENTADAVADAVVRVLTGNTTTPVHKVMKVAARAARRSINANSNTNVNVIGRRETSAELLDDDDDVYARNDMNATARELDYAEEGHERIEDDELGAEDDDALEDDTADPDEKKVPRSVMIRLKMLLLRWLRKLVEQKYKKPE
ncbi:uncharacterized protein [Chelonus insularis]|uniref:uncharacterized protein isoform X2 n=1 Tax=Chelonus insularis TaxID=460826 RepID=UPI00158D3157|nr:uncharacterized protein LOC118067537 isoform X2 [Chelonus insularis]